MNESKNGRLGELIFYLNGKKIVKCNPDPCVLLAQFLREELKLTGTKIACDGGGCGSCTVLISKFDRVAANIVHYSANACVIPVCSLHGLAVTTIEALGNTKTRLHQIQERLVKSHGIQCGFCSPGMVMSLYALLRNSPQPTQLQVEQAVQGNLCRCTGYRPILDAFKSFASDMPPCPLGEQCCQNTNNVNKVNNDCEASSAILLSDSSQELIFPSELQLSDIYDKQSLMFGTDTGVLWYRPSSLSELLSLKAHHSQARLVSGATTVAFSLKKCFKPSVFISTTGCSGLNTISSNETHLVVGAHVTISQLETTLRDLSHQLPETKTKFASALLDMFTYFGSTQIRNCATVGGSLAMRNPEMDFNIVLLAMPDSHISVASEGGWRKVPVKEFITDQNIGLQSHEVLVGIEIPFTDENEFVGSFKHAARREMAEAYVNGAMYVQFEANTNVISAAHIAVGGILCSAAAAYDLNQYLSGRKWDLHLVDGLLPQLLPKLHDNTVSSHDVSWKLAAMQGFLFRFHLQVYQQLSQTLGLEDLSTAGHLYLETISERRCSVRSGVQVYQVAEPVSDADSVGQPLHHRWAAQCSTGEAVFIDDIPSSRDELYVALVTSTKANARLVNVDASAALAMPGVVGFLDHTSVPGSNLTGGSKSEEIFATTHVRWVGQTIGAVVAVSHDTARRASTAVSVTYDELPAVITLEEAIAQNLFHECPPYVNQISRGDTKAAFELCHHVINGEVRIGSQEHFYMETHSVRVVPAGEDGEIDVYSGEQWSTLIQEQLASVLNIMSNKITVHVKRMGGAFGGKEFRTFLVTLPTAIAAQRYSQPARCILDRAKDMQITGYRRPSLAKYKIGFNKDGKLQALDITMYANDGYISEHGWAFTMASMTQVDACYAVSNISARGYQCRTNLPPSSVMRGAGQPQAAFIAEHWIRAVADFLNVSTAEIQKLNMYEPGALSVVNVSIEASLGHCFDDVLEQSCYHTEVQRVLEFNSKSRYVKRGIDVVPLKFGPGLPAFWMQAAALVHIYLDGSVLISHGGAESGQGLHTKMIQVASRSLDVPIDLIHISETASDLVANAVVTGGSSGSEIFGGAVMNACKILLERLKPYRQTNPDSTWQELVNAAYADRVNLSCIGFFKCPHSIGFDWQNLTGHYCSYYTYGAAVVQVEVDCLTGNYVIPKVDIVMDVGKSLNPAIDVGQIEGGFVMGLGFYALEEHRFNASGHLETIGAGKYHIPSVSSVPLQMNITLLKDCGNPKAVYSSRGIGEPPLLLSSAVFFAIRNAVKSARADAGFSPDFVFDSPATVHKILLACSTP